LRETLRATIGVFLVTGAFLAVQRLSSAALPPTYFAALAVKVALALAMFGAARRLAVAAGPPVGAWWQTPEVTVLGLGVAIYALAIALRAIYEDTIRLP
jgi:Ca2+/H+ antiporter